MNNKKIISSLGKKVFNLFWFSFILLLVLFLSWIFYLVYQKSTTDIFNAKQEVKLLQQKIDKLPNKDLSLELQDKLIFSKKTENWKNFTSLDSGFGFKSPEAWGDFIWNCSSSCRGRFAYLGDRFFIEKVDNEKVSELSLLLNQIKFKEVGVCDDFVFEKLKKIRYGELRYCQIIKTVNGDRGLLFRFYNQFLDL